jgi:hypothetical protein
LAIALEGRLQSLKKGKFGIAAAPFFTFTDRVKSIIMGGRFRHDNMTDMAE